MDISVIIVNYNTCRITCECLNSIFTFTKGVDFEVIVVDNDSCKDDSKEVLSKYPGIKYIQSGENLGFGKANNMGYPFSTGRYVLLLNSDTYLLNNALKIFVNRFDSLDKSIGCIGSILLSPDGNPVNSYNRFHTIKGAVSHTFNAYLNRISLRPNEAKAGTEGYNMYVPYIIGADLCIRRSVIEECGLFDPDFFMYFEDVELQQRYLRNGYKSYIIEGPSIVHLECVSSNGKTKGTSFFTKKIFLEGQVLYYKKVYSYWKYLLWRLFFVSNIPFYISRNYSLKENIILLSKFIAVR